MNKIECPNCEEGYLKESDGMLICTNPNCSHIEEK